jgi:16S rRNA (cytidine1402-2'-O)-methyltransferase
VAEVRRQLAARDRVRGEITLLVEARPLADRSPQSALLAQESIASQVARIQADTGADEKEALKHLARATGRSKSDLYRELQRERSHRPGPGGTRRE